MEKDIEGCIFEKAKESLNKIGMYAGEKEKTDYDPDINSISKRDLENIISWSSFCINEIFKNLHTQHRNDIRDSKILSNVRRLMWSECDSKLLIPTIKYLENEGLLSRSEFALALMQYVYDERIDLDKSNFKFKINRLEGAFWHNYVLYNPDVAQILMQGANLDENRKYEMAKEKFIKDYVLSKYGTTSPMHTAREDFYSRKLSENDFSFVIGDAILKEYGVDIDPKEVKKLFNERAQQLQKENIKKSQLQQREEELSDLEMERDELLLIEKRDEQQNIGE